MKGLVCISIFGNNIEDGTNMYKDKRIIHKIIREEIEKVISEIKLSDYKSPNKPFVVRHQNDRDGKQDRYFTTKQEAADYCYKIGLNNVFDIGAILNGQYAWYNFTHLINLIDKKEEQQERLKSLEKIVKKWKNGVADVE